MKSVLLHVLKCISWYLNYVRKRKGNSVACNFLLLFELSNFFSLWLNAGKFAEFTQSNYTKSNKSSKFTRIETFYLKQES